MCHEVSNYAGDDIVLRIRSEINLIHQSGVDRHRERVELDIFGMCAQLGYEKGVWFDCVGFVLLTNHWPFKMMLFIP